MKNVNWPGLGLALALAVTTRGEDSTFREPGLRLSLRYDRDAVGVFRQREFSLDLFGTYATRDAVGMSHDRGGGGLGVNYFFLRHVGLGADSYLEEWRWPHRVNSSVIFRLPIDTLHLAPYLLGGGGREFKQAPQWSLHAGSGLEFRLNSNTSFFADGRRIFPDKTADYTMIRGGFRLGF